MERTIRIDISAREEAAEAAKLYCNKLPPMSEAAKQSVITIFVEGWVNGRKAFLQTMIKEGMIQGG